MKLHSMINKYEVIIELLCKYKGINSDELFKLLEDRELKYILFLLLKKYNCADFEKLKRDFLIKSKRIVNYNYKKAQEKFFVNSAFREMYLEAENIMENTEYEIN
jgi:hypothetical protein